jgi:Na+-transporting NADH:ubiquinone oxidoreductase subunit NqrF
VSREIIEKCAKGSSDPVFYICGPEQMKKSCLKALASIGVRRKDIVVESFFW